MLGEYEIRRRENLFIRPLIRFYGMNRRLLLIAFLALSVSVVIAGCTTEDTGDGVNRPNTGDGGGDPGQLTFESVDAPAVVQPGEEFTATMTIACNDGDGCESEVVTISSGATEYIRRDVSVPANQDHQVAARPSFDDVGTHTIQFRLGGDARFRDVTVQSLTP